MSYCHKRVFSGERGDMRGHLCGVKPPAGEDYCYLHNDKREEVDPSAPAIGAPKATFRTEVTRYASLAWEPGEGPVVRIPYQRGHGFITRAYAKRVDQHEPQVGIVGCARRKDGTPGERRWDARFDAGSVLGPELLAELLELLTRTEP